MVLNKGKYHVWDPELKSLALRFFLKDVAEGLVLLFIEKRVPEIAFLLAEILAQICVN